MIAVFVGFALLASAMIANKIALLSLSPTLFVAIRMLGAGFLLLAYYWGRTDRVRWSYFKHDIWLLLSISILTTLIPSLFKAYALKHMISAKFSFLGSVDPFITAFYAYLLWGERLTGAKIVGMLLGLISLLIMFWAVAPQEANLLVFGRISYPELAALAAPLLGRIGWMLIQYLIRKERYTAGQVNGLTMSMSGIAAFIISYATEAWILPTPTPWVSLSAAMIYTIVVGNIIALTMYAYFLKYHSATFLSLAGFSVNFFVALYGWLLLGEVPPVHFYSAAAVMILALIVFYAQEIRAGYTVWTKSLT